MTFLSHLYRIKAIVLDVDGVLTDGTVLVTETGEQLRRYNVRDGYVIKLALRKGIKFCAISGGTAKNISLRLNGLGIEEVYLGIDDKASIFHSYLEKQGLLKEDILFMGDDIPDLPLMELAGIAVCPADAMEEIKAVSHYISPFKGGEGCVRDVIEKVLKIQGKWFNQEDEKITSA